MAELEELEQEDLDSQLLEVGGPATDSLPSVPTAEPVKRELNLKRQAAIAPIHSRSGWWELGSLPVSSIQFGGFLCCRMSARLPLCFCPWFISLQSTQETESFQICQSCIWFHRAFWS